MNYIENNFFKYSIQQKLFHNIMSDLRETPCVYSAVAVDAKTRRQQPTIRNSENDDLVIYSNSHTNARHEKCSKTPLFCTPRKGMYIVGGTFI